MKCVKLVIYSCESCRKEFNRKDNLDQHRKTCKVAKAQVPNKTCFKCGYNFQKRFNLQKNLKRGCTNVNHTCQKCGKMYTKEKHYQSHLVKCGQPSNQEAAFVVSRTSDNRATSAIYDFTVTELPQSP